MPSVTIDAGALAVPPHNVSAEDAHSYVISILGWSRLIDCSWMEVNMSQCSSEALVKDGLFPFYPQLRKLIADTGIENFDANTVNTVILKLLAQSQQTFEEYFGVSNVKSEELCVSPDILCLSVGDALRSDLSRCLILTAILRKCSRKSVHSHALVLRHAPSQVVNVRAVIKEIQHDRSDLGDLPVYPEVFEGEVLTCDDFGGLIECLDGASMLASAQDKMGISAAVRVALFTSRLKRGERARWDELPKFRVGDNFLATALKACRREGALPGKILRAMVETLDGLNLDYVHALRSGEGGGNPQQIRGKDRAWRRDIDPSHHLHYWSCADRIVELADVSFPHDDFSITY